jgi:hypothetical protein
LPAPGPARRRALAWLLLILLAAAALRLAALPDVPPGFTHDEADHGLDAWGVVNGARPLYFTVGYGREPLFDYATAGLMAFLGPTYLAGRLTAVFFSLLLVAGTYAWTRRAFGRRVALLAAAGLAVSFWAVMTGRHALRSVTMPALFALAAAAFWDGLGAGRPAGAGFIPARPVPAHRAVVAGLLLGATFYAYLPARILWALFPGLLVYWALFRRESFRRLWRPTLVTLGVAALVGTPLFIYLQTNPGAEIRLTQLSGPLDAALVGDWGPFGRNLTGALRLFTVEGDSLWRYNIPGKPWLDPVMGALFYAGLLLAVVAVIQSLTRRRSGPFRLPPAQADAAVFALAWLGAGLVPAVITGPEASVTRAIAMQPVLYLFPALALSAAYRLASPRIGDRRRYAPLAAVLLFGAVGAGTARDYFGAWANHPEVRVQYETTLVTAVDYLNGSDGGAAALSTATPDRFHSPSTALMTLRNPAVTLRWFNGAHSLVLPAAPEATVLFPGFAPLHPDLAPYFAPVGEPEVLSLRPDDIDRPLIVYQIRPDAVLATWQKRARPLDAALGDVATLVGYELLTPEVGPGEAVQLVTLWQVRQPTTGLVLFTHLPDESGAPLAQADRLDVPSFYWLPGDHFAQLHAFTLPAELPVGVYPLRVGGYVCVDTPCEPNPARLPIGDQHSSGVDSLRLPQDLVVRDGGA